MQTEKKKRTWSKFALPIGASVGILALSSIALAGMGHKFKHGSPFLRLVQSLDLTEDQELQAVRIQREQREQKKALHQEMRRSMDQVMGALKTAEPDPEILHGVANQTIANFSKMIHGTIDQYLELHRTLSPEQRVKLSKRAEKLKERHDRHFSDKH